jgi:hypothetical protein
MGAVITDLLYILISTVLVGIVGRALSRNSRAFLPQRFGHDGMAEAVSRILVVAFYLLAAGFIALTMPTWSHVGSPGLAMELLSEQVGILLLMLGGLHLAGTAVLARLRRGRPLTATGPAGVAAARSGNGASASAAAGSSARGTTGGTRGTTGGTGGTGPGGGEPGNGTSGGSGPSSRSAISAISASEADETGEAGEAGSGGGGSDLTGDGLGTGPAARTGSTGFWRPQPRHVIH